MSRFELYSAEVDGDVTINTAEGHDRIRIWADIDGSLFIYGGEGDDSVSVRGAFAGDVTVDAAPARTRFIAPHTPPPET